MNVESELKSIINRLYNIQDVSGPDLSKKIYEIILQCREAIGYRKAELDRVQSSRKPIKSADKHFNYDEYLGDIYDSDRSNADSWSREEYNEMVETARGIFYPAVQKAANACHFTVSDNEVEYVAEKCVRCFFDNTSWDEAVNRPEEYYVNSSCKLIKSDYHDKEIYRQAFGTLLEDYAPEGDFPGGYRVLVDGNYETEFSANSREEAIKKFKDYFANKKKGINNSKKSIKSSNLPKEVYYIVINGAKQYFEDREKAKEMAAELGVGSVYTETDPEEIQELYEVGYIGSSRKSIKSSLEDRLVPYLEEFEEGFADTQVVAPGDEMDIPSRQETFFEIFKNDYNLSDEDINKLKDAVMSIWEATAGN